MSVFKIQEFLKCEVAQLIHSERQPDNIVNNGNNEKTEEETAANDEQNLVWEEFDNAVETPKEIHSKAATIKNYLQEENIFENSDDETVPNNMVIQEIDEDREADEEGANEEEEVVPRKKA
ncbi:unnamed protein product [Diabrotica balteata]|uniref:Uncharacterized protein n=1 Tax=Diabrotica balteata TaxID=107213 RepID=A0A9N9X8K2_DIABA|nr:unnamed protein product [Diabrotica balteata]